uniref:ORF111 n=1 Tax=Saccharolobus islandicus TaxID=43080 RepID=Q9C4Y6_SACIS|nr:ORF111 [Sulfolobus islandicus]
MHRQDQNCCTQLGVGVNNLPRHTATYMQIWITNELNTPVRIYNLTILPKGNAEIVQVCDYAPYVNANNIPAQDLNGTLEPQETVVLLVAYNLSDLFYIGPMTIILHANTTA